MLTADDAFILILSDRAHQALRTTLGPLQMISPHAHADLEDIPVGALFEPREVTNVGLKAVSRFRLLAEAQLTVPRPRHARGINRCVTGVLADLHCASTRQAVANLTAEGAAGKIELTGNTIVEATLGMLPDEAAARDIAAGLRAEPGQYVLATIHRPENTDDPEQLGPSWTS